MVLGLDGSEVLNSDSSLTLLMFTSLSLSNVLILFKSTQVVSFSIDHGPLRETSMTSRIRISLVVTSTIDELLL